MKHPWQAWTLFLSAFSVVLGAMAWVTHTVIQLEAENKQAEERAYVEENVRLALWRMDSAIAPLIVEENNRPYVAYSSFYPATAVNPVVSEDNSEVDTTLVPSPLVAATPNHVKLHLACTAPAGATITSPQVPNAVQRKWTEDIYANGELIDHNATLLKQFEQNVDRQQLWGSFDLSPATTLVVTTQSTQPDGNNYLYWGDDGLQQALAPLDPHIEINADEIQSVSGNNEGDAQPLANQGDVSQIAQAQQVEVDYINLNDRVQERGQVKKPTKQTPWQSSLNQTFRGNTEFNKRAGRNTIASKRAVDNRQYRYGQKDVVENSNPQKVVNARFANQRSRTLQPQAKAQTKNIVPQAASTVQEDIMRPVWINDLLMLGRRVDIDGRPHLQAAWLDWDSIREELLSEIADIFPEASLSAVTNESVVDGSRLMAALPVQLTPGPLASPLASVQSPLALPLTIAWGCVIFSALAIALLLFGTLSLSERRGAFVSAVTHELRTPLTTFRMYTEMLAEGIIRDEDKKAQYLDTLHKESNRLGHLVENVLTYSQLERGAGPRKLETCPVDTVLAHVTPPLQDRVGRSEMELTIEASDIDRQSYMATDIAALEQILTNLVDNACKYASSASDKRIHLTATRERSHVVFRVCDHGPGLDRKEARLLFKPFRKSATAAAQSAPGVGLGLALCRRLANQLGGELSYEHRAEAGACFALRIPCVKG